MSNKTQELVSLLKEHSDRELIFLYPEECSDDYYTLGYPSRILKDEYVIYADRVWLKEDNSDEIFEQIADDVFDDLFPHKSYANEEDEEKINRVTKQRIDQLEWKKAIVVYIKP